MSLSSLILANKDLLEFAYALIIASICVIIVVKIDKIYRLSLHKGVRYFRNAFFFYGLAFITRYLFGFFSDYFVQYILPLKLVFEYLLIMAGFFLIYSLIWKKFEKPHANEYFSSLFNSKVAIFHAMAIIISFADLILETYQFMFISQILLFLYAGITSYTNQKAKGEKHNFLKFYFTAIVLFFIAWILNSLVALFFAWNKFAMMGAGVMNILFFILVLYGVVKFTK